MSGGLCVCVWGGGRVGAGLDELLISFSPPTIWPTRLSYGQGSYDNMPPGTSL